MKKSQELSCRLKRRASLSSTWLEKMKSDLPTGCSLTSADCEQESCLKKAVFTDTTNNCTLEANTCATETKTEWHESKGKDVSTDRAACSFDWKSSLESSEINCDVENNVVPPPQEDNNISLKGAQSERVTEVGDCGQRSSQNVSNSILGEANCEIQKSALAEEQASRDNDCHTKVLPDKKRKAKMTPGNAPLRKLPKLNNSKVIPKETSRENDKELSSIR